MAKVKLAGLSKAAHDAQGSLWGYIVNGRTSVNCGFSLYMYSILDHCYFSFYLVAMINTKTKRNLRRIGSIFLSFLHHCPSLAEVKVRTRAA